MDLQLTKYQLIEQLTRINDANILEQIQTLLENWRAAELNESLERGFEQSERGEGIPHEDVMRELRKRYGAE